MVAAGRLTERLLVRRERSDTFDSRGQYKAVPETVATVWGEVLPLSGEEAVVARKLEANTSHQVTIRYSSDVADLSPEWWFGWGSTATRLDIAAVINTENRNTGLVCLCGLKTT